MTSNKIAIVRQTLKVPCPCPTIVTAFLHLVKKDLLKKLSRQLKDSELPKQNALVLVINIRPPRMVGTPRNYLVLKKSALGLAVVKSKTRQLLTQLLSILLETVQQFVLKVPLPIALGTPRFTLRQRTLALCV